MRKAYNQQLMQLVKKRDDRGIQNLLKEMKDKGVPRDKVTWSQILLWHTKRNDIKQVQHVLNDMSKVLIYLYIHTLFIYLFLIHIYI